MPELDPKQFSPDVANRFRREQMRHTIEQMRIFVMANTIFAPILSAQAWNIGAYALVIGWTVATVALSWALLLIWMKMYHTDGSIEDMERFERHAFINAAIWVSGGALYYPIVAESGKVIVATILTGALALGTLGYSRAPFAALIYLSVLTIGGCVIGLVTGLTTGGSIDLLFSVLAIFAGGALVNAVLERGKADAIAFKNHQRLSEKSDVIELLLKDYEEQATEWLWQTDTAGRVVGAPDQILELLEVDGTREELPDLVELITARHTPESKDDVARLTRAFKRRVEFYDVQISIEDQHSGTLRWIMMKGRPQFENLKFQGFRGIFADATATVEAERRVGYLAAYDGLTGLLNRHSVQKRLSELDASQDKVTAFLIDLDGFKQVNDGYGHQIGDDLLKVVSDRLEHFVQDNGWAARLAGDEFLIVLDDHSGHNTALLQVMGQDICDRLSEPFEVEQFELQVSASVGIASFPKDTNQGLDLLSLSDLALYEAKNGGRDRAVTFDDTMLKKLNRRISILDRLKHAVRNGEIQLFYQPQHRLSDGRLVGFESLARWFDKELGTIGPDTFIPIAEQTGLIVELGEQLLRKACQDALRWAELLGPDAPVMSVNISPVQFARIDVAQMISRVLADVGLPAHLIEIEVTEGVLISDKQRVAATLRQLSEMGITIALDDFGTGYSSLSYLKALPLNRLKIDRTFVNDLQHASDGTIVSTVIQLGHNLGLNVIAEGLETQEQLDRLATLGCDDGQGYFYSKPMSVEDADQYITDIKGNAYQNTG